LAVSLDGAAGLAQHCGLEMLRVTHQLIELVASEKSALQALLLIKKCGSFGSGCCSRCD
jgi:hypothetical protein